jgi:hypothetical protein
MAEDMMASFDKELLSGTDSDQLWNILSVFDELSA